jgi:hypothetical protein
MLNAIDLLILFLFYSNAVQASAYSASWMFLCEIRFKQSNQRIGAVRHSLELPGARTWGLVLVVPKSRRVLVRGKGCLGWIFEPWGSSWRRHSGYTMVAHCWPVQWTGRRWLYRAVGHTIPRMVSLGKKEVADSAAGTVGNRWRRTRWGFYKEAYQGRSA